MLKTIRKSTESRNDIFDEKERYYAAVLVFCLTSCITKCFPGGSKTSLSKLSTPLRTMRPKNYGNLWRHRDERHLVVISSLVIDSCVLFYTQSILNASVCIIYDDAKTKYNVLSNMNTKMLEHLTLGKVETSRSCYRLHATIHLKKKGYKRLLKEAHNGSYGLI